MRPAGWACGHHAVYLRLRVLTTASVVSGLIGTIMLAVTPCTDFRNEQWRTRVRQRECGLAGNEAALHRLPASVRMLSALQRVPRTERRRTETAEERS